MNAVVMRLSKNMIVVTMLVFLGELFLDSLQHRHFLQY